MICAFNSLLGLLLNREGKNGRGVEDKVAISESPLCCCCCLIYFFYFLFWTGGSY